MTLVLLLVLPCQLWAGGPLRPGVWGFQARNAYVEWCHAPMEASEVVLDVRIKADLPGCATFYPPTVRDHDRGVIGIGPEEKPSAVLCWKRENVRQRVTVQLGVEYLPLDLGLYLTTRARLRMDLLEAR